MSLMRPCAILVLSVCVLASCGPSGQSTESQKSESGASAASQAAPKAPAPLKDRIKEGIDRGIRVLRDHQDPKTGAVSFASPYQAEQRHPGVTALALLAYLQSPRNYRSDDGPFVRNALEWLTSLQKADGSIYERDSRNYVTSVALTALVASEEPAYQPAIERARDWIVDLQAREDTGYKP
ncbi:MAG: hypothetical protein KDB53_15440, partial [Planctomycetes bacterium]|nr:hypothetical protein [Planctomycetota bacterium]